MAMDTAGKFDDPDGDGNVTRRGWTANSQEVGFSAPIHVDVLTVPKLLLDNMPIQITFSKTPDNVLILNGPGKKKNVTREKVTIGSDGVETKTNETVEVDDPDANIYRIVLTELELRVKKIQLRQELSVDLDRKLASGMRMRYPLTRSKRSLTFFTTVQ